MNRGPKCGYAGPFTHPSANAAPHLFQYMDADGRPQPVDSSDVNHWLRDVMGGDFSAKDFRTWGASSMAFAALASTAPPVRADGGPAPEQALAAMENAVVAQVAGVLGNTRAICRSAYTDPALFPAWRDGRLAHHAQGARGERQWERATLRFLRAERRMQGRRRI